MNGTGTGYGRGPGWAGTWRVGVLAAAVAGVAVLAAACGGSGGATAPAALTAYQKALAYSHCMRSHGVPSFPDPQSNGAILTSPKNHLAQGSASFVAASKACQHLLPPAVPLTTAEQQKIAALMLKMAACMRAHGITSFPDPVVNARVVEFNPHGLDVHSPQFVAAQRVCRKYSLEAQKYIPLSWADG